jgi:6-phosphofructokinase 1
VSDVDSKEAREVGTRAVEFAMSGDVDGSVAIKRVDEYHIEYILNPLETVAGKTKHMPDEFFDSDTMVSEKFLTYLRPLVGELGEVVLLDAPNVL